MKGSWFAAAFTTTLLATLISADRVVAQYMYLDTDGDGIPTSADKVVIPGVVNLGVWLRTDVNRDGSTAVCGGGGTLTITSYEFTLRAENGTVLWGAYQNAQSATMQTLLGSGMSPTEFHIGFGGATSLPPGTYQLGTIPVLVSQGSPSIAVVSDSTAATRTSFGSSCAGSAGNNTLTLGADWSDADGLAPSAFSVVFAEDFESSSGSLPSYWETRDDDGSNFLVPWGVTNSYCGYTLGNYSATGAQGYCNSYENHQDALLYHKNGIPTSRYSQYYLFFRERHALAGSDRLRWYNATSADGSIWVDSWQGNASGTSSGWVDRTVSVIDNSSHSYDFYRPKFEFVSDSTSTSTGAYVDAIQVYGTTRPDIVVSTASGAPTVGGCGGGSLIAGQDQTWCITYTLRNGGGTASSDFHVRLVVDNSDSTEFSELGLAAGAQRTTTYSRSGLSAGPHSIKLVMDCRNEIDESRSDDSPELNNRYALPTNPVWLAPDLSILSIVPSGGANAKMGSAVDVVVTVKNQGTFAAGQFRVAWYRDRASPPITGTTPDSFVQVTSLGVNGTQAVTFKARSDIAGTWRMYAFADYQNSVANEPNEANNILGPSSLTWVPKTIIVRGVFQYDDSIWGGTTSTYCNDIQLLDWDPPVGGNPARVDTLGSVAAQWQTNVFEFPAIVNEDTNNDHGYLDLFLRVNYRSNEACWDTLWSNNWFVSIVVPPNADSLWHYDWAGPTNASMDTLNVGILTPTNYGDRAALHLLKTISQRGWGFVRDITPASFSFPELKVFYAPGYDPLNTAYKAEFGVMWVGGTNDTIKYFPDAWDDGVILHEYGHYLAHRFGFVQLAGGDHEYLKPADSKALAWNEGFADFFGGLRGNDPYASGYGTRSDYANGPNGLPKKLDFRDFESDVQQFSGKINLSTIDSTGSALHGGPWVQGSIACSLWDLLDSHNETGGSNTFGDTVADGFAKIWNTLLTTPNPATDTTDVNWFEAKYLSLNAPDGTDYSHALAIRRVFLDHGIGSGSDSAMVTGVVAEASGSRSIRMLGATPNPFNPRTKIRIVLSGFAQEPPVIKIFDVHGRRIRTLILRHPHAGMNTVVWDGTQSSGRQVASGVYFAEVVWGRLWDRAKLVVLR